MVANKMWFSLFVASVYNCFNKSHFKKYLTILMLFLKASSLIISLEFVEDNSYSFSQFHKYVYSFLIMLRNPWPLSEIKCPISLLLNHISHITADNAQWCWTVICDNDECTKALGKYFGENISVIYKMQVMKRWYVVLPVTDTEC